MKKNASRNELVDDKSCRVIVDGYMLVILAISLGQQLTIKQMWPMYE